MSKIIQAVKGMNDVLPAEEKMWQLVEGQLKLLAQQFFYQEIRTPILEKTELFKRSIGEVTDIVSKEMYTFDDLDGTSLSLRPEGTAPIVRAGIERGLFYNQIQRLWYLGPIFRHERPQRGRYRQFFQFGLEAIGMSGPAIEAEQILFNHQFFERIDLRSKIKLEINSLGTSDSRKRYRAVLLDYLQANRDRLDEDSLLRLEKNPLRILDSKNPSLQSLIVEAPKLIDHLESQSQENFCELQECLSDLNIEFSINPHLVRGLDYYSETVYEWVTTELGAQGTVSAGGRYDQLIEQLGGKKNAAVGFAMGIERIIELLKNQVTDVGQEPIPDIYFVLVGKKAVTVGLDIARQLRDEMALKVFCNLQGTGLKNQLKKAEKSNAKCTLILNEPDIENNTIKIWSKSLLTGNEQVLDRKDLLSNLKQMQLF